MKNDSIITDKNRHNTKNPKKLNMMYVKVGVIATLVGIITFPSIIANADITPKNETETIKNEMAIENALLPSETTMVKEVVAKEENEVVKIDSWINHIPSTEQKKIADYNYQKKVDYITSLYAPEVEEEEEEVEVIIASKTNDEVEVVNFNSDTDSVDVANTEDTTDTSSESNAEQPTEDATATEDTSESESSYYVYGTFELTAYCATGNPCADGVYPSVGYTVACNDPALWHKWIHIEGYGDYYVHDTGGMASNVIDIFMGSYDECIQFGRRSATVYVYN